MKKEEVLYQVSGKDQNGKPVREYIPAEGYFDIRKKIKAHKSFRDGSVTTIRRKKNYSYSIKSGTKSTEGFQAAFSKQEVVTALKRMGFHVRYVRREFDIRLHASTNELITFIETSARLLEQKLPYHEVLQIMAKNVRDRNLKIALHEIISDLKNGKDSRDAFVRQSKVFGKHNAIMLGIASKSGDMKSVFQSVAQLVERQAEFSKALISSLIFPAVTSAALLAAIIYYVVYLLPKMVALLAPIMELMPPLTASTLKFSSFFSSHMTLMIISSILTITGFYSYVSTEKGRLLFDRFIIRMPYIGKILLNTSTEIFCRILGILYTSAGENIEAIQIAADACGNRYVARQIRSVAIPSMLKFGTDLSKSLEATNCFPDLFISRFKTATETGAVKETALLVADYYQMENKYALKNLITIIEIAVTVVIMAALIFLTLLSSELSTIDINPK